MLNLKALAVTCESSSCPTVWTSDEIAAGNVLVQGYVVDNVSTPDGETMVQVPVALLRDAISKL